MLFSLLLIYVVYYIFYFYFCLDNMFVQFLCLISLIYVDSTVQICFISHSYLINGTFPYGCITVVYNYILGQLILHNCVLTISVNSLYTLYSLNVDTMFYTVIQSTELVSYYTVDIGL